MKRTYGTQPLMADINITPFTDVILVLLIIFMIATPLISQNSIQVKLPKASSQDVLNDTKPVYVTITGEGVVYIEDKAVNSKELKAKISYLVKKSSDLKVILAADQACRFQEVVRVIDTLKELGVKSVNIATRSNNK